MIGLGCMGFSQGYGPADDEESLIAMRRAAELGITMFDTAMSYGEGHNERLIGRLDRPVQIATKFGIVRSPTGVGLDADPARISAYCDASLQRLGRDVIDLYYLHRVDPRFPIEETVGAMAALVEAGKVRSLGLSEVTPAELERAVAVHPIAAVQFEWSLLWREPETDIVPAARRHGCRLVAYSPLGRGLLTATLSGPDVSAGFRSNDDRFQGDHLERNLAMVAQLQSIAASLSCTPGQLALAWLLAQGPDVVPIPGSRKLSRIEENAAATSITLSPADRTRIDAALSSGWSGNRHSFAVPTTTRSPT